MNGSHEDGGKHISGGERLIPFREMKRTVNALLEKGLSHSRGKPDFMQIQFEEVYEPIKTIQPLAVHTNEVSSPEEGQKLARLLLEREGVPREVIEKAYDHLNGRVSGERWCLIFTRASGLTKQKEKGCGYPEWIGRTPILKNGRSTVT